MTASMRLKKELEEIKEDNVEGFIVKLLDEDNFFEWEVALFGPPQTIYEGGYFKCILKFPNDYPFRPPSLRFKCQMWHPNIHQNGKMCISILHPLNNDSDDMMMILGDLPSERWTSAQTVRSVLLSVISMLNEPNTLSPANVFASVMYQRWKESNGEDKEYENIIRKQVATSKIEAEKDDVHVPTTNEEYCIKRVEPEYLEFSGNSDEEYDEYESDEDEDDNNSDHRGDHLDGSDDTT